jgi:hypothetical protein
VALVAVVWAQTQHAGLDALVALGESVPGEAFLSELQLRSASDRSLSELSRELNMGMLNWSPSPQKAQLAGGEIIPESPYDIPARFYAQSPDPPTLEVHVGEGNADDVSAGGDGDDDEGGCSLDARFVDDEKSGTATVGAGDNVLLTPPKTPPSRAVSVTAATAAASTGPCEGESNGGTEGDVEITVASKGNETHIFELELEVGGQRINLPTSSDGVEGVGPFASYGFQFGTVAGSAVVTGVDPDGVAGGRVLVGDRLLSVHGTIVSNSSHEKVRTHMCCPRLLRG